MNKIKFVSKIILAASFSLAMVSTFSCSSDNVSENPDWGKSSGSHGQSTQQSSSGKSDVYIGESSSSAQHQPQSSSSSNRSSSSNTPTQSSSSDRSSSSNNPTQSSSSGNSSSSNTPTQSSSSGNSSSSSTPPQSSSSEQPKLSSSSISGTEGLKFYSNVEVRCGNTLGNPWFDGKVYSVDDYIETAEGYSKDGNYPYTDTLYVKLNSGLVTKTIPGVSAPKNSIMCSHNGYYKGQTNIVRVGDSNFYSVGLSLPDEICNN